MSYVTVEVEFDNGRITKGSERLPKKGAALLTILEPTTYPQPRPVGLAKGQFHVPDDFNAPLPDEIVSAFEGR